MAKSPLRMDSYSDAIAIKTLIDRTRQLQPAIESFTGLGQNPFAFFTANEHGVYVGAKDGPRQVYTQINDVFPASHLARKMAEMITELNH